MKIVKNHNGIDVYQGFNYPDNIDGLDKQIILNTLNYYEFIADMSDDYQQTLKERQHIEKYRQKHNLWGN